MLLQAGQQCRHLICCPFFVLQKQRRRALGRHERGSHPEGLDPQATCPSHLMPPMQAHCDASHSPGGAAWQGALGHLRWLGAAAPAAGSPLMKQAFEVWEGAQQQQQPPPRAAALLTGGWGLSQGLAAAEQPGCGTHAQRSAPPPLECRRRQLPLWQQCCCLRRPQPCHSSLCETLPVGLEEHATSRKPP